MEKIKNLHALEQHGWLCEQSGEFRAWAAGAGRWRNFDQDQGIYLAGDPPDGLYGLLDGALELTLPFDGEDSVTLHRAGTGFWVGDLAVLSQRPRMISLIAARRSRLFFIPTGKIHNLLAKEPRFWPSFYRLSNINQNLTLNLLAESLVLSPQKRVVRHLIRLSDAGDAIPASHADLAKLIGVTRSTLQRAITELADAGAIRTGYRQIEILDRARLVGMSGLD